MARARTIKHGFFTNDELCSLPPLARILFAGLWCVADRDGRLLDRPRKIKADILPYDRCDVDQLLAMLAKSGFIERYEVAGVACVQVLNWAKHQNPHPREVESLLPAAPWLSNGKAVAEPGPGSDLEMSGRVAIPSGPSGTSIPSVSLTGSSVAGRPSPVTPAGPGNGYLGKAAAPPSLTEHDAMMADHEARIARERSVRQPQQLIDLLKTTNGVAP